LDFATFWSDETETEGREIEPLENASPTVKEWTTSLSTFGPLSSTMTDQPQIKVGIVDRQTEVSGHLHGDFLGEGFGSLTGRFSAKAKEGTIVLFNEAGRQVHRSSSIKLTALEDSTFKLFNVTIGSRFHWERKEDQVFQGNLILRLREDGTVCAINEVSLEDYLTSVISSEMNAAAPMEFLKTHAILSRSWLLAAFHQKGETEESSPPAARSIKEGEILRWYGREDHDLFHVCADDHCQRYQGITKIATKQAEEAVRETGGIGITYQDKICDARYSKCCGGLTEEFNTAWHDQPVPYLRSISDAPKPLKAIRTEEEASAWVLSNPEAYCNTKDEGLLEKILPDVDRETKTFFRWTVEFSQQELEEILRQKSGLDFGTLQEIVSLRRGPSGRIYRLKIAGSKKSMVVGKELEIRRWLSRSHLYSSAFVVTREGGRFVFRGAGWGHGVGLCQIGAGVMASRGFSAEEILKHYFHGVEIKKIY
jgi:SpoIID/LytB domain protein